MLALSFLFCYQIALLFLVYNVIPSVEGSIIPRVVGGTIPSVVAQPGRKTSPSSSAMSDGKSGPTTMSSAKSASTTVSSSALPTVTANSAVLNANVMDCSLKLPNNALTAEGLATPFELQAPCSQSVFLQQSFAEAAIIDPTTGNISIYHPLVINAGMTPQAAPVVPTIPNGAQVALWFGFNGGVLKLIDQNGEDTNQSPTLKGMSCVNGLPGTQGDVFGQVSWCNTAPFWSAANTAVQNNLLTVPALGTDSKGNSCPTTRSFAMVDACPSDNVPTQYLLLSDGSTVQDTAANRKKFPNAKVINNGSDEALLTLSLDPAIGCTPFLAPSLDDPGATVSSLATSELQAKQLQQSPIALVPLNDPDCLLTSSGAVSVAKTDAYRSGVNQPQVSDSSPAVAGQLDFYCTSLMEVQPAFILEFQDKFSQTTTPDSMTGNNLFTFMCARYLMSLQQLKCPSASSQPVAIQTNGNGVATACTIQSSVLKTTAASIAGATSSSTNGKDVTSSGSSVQTTNAPSVAGATSSSTNGKQITSSSDTVKGVTSSGSSVQTTTAPSVAGATSSSTNGKQITSSSDTVKDATSSGSINVQTTTAPSVAGAASSTSNEKHAASTSNEKHAASASNQKHAASTSNEKHAASSTSNEKHAISSVAPVKAVISSVAPVKAVISSSAPVKHIASSSSIAKHVASSSFIA